VLLSGFALLAMAVACCGIPETVSCKVLTLISAEHHAQLRQCLYCIAEAAAYQCVVRRCWYACVCLLVALIVAAAVLRPCLPACLPACLDVSTEFMAPEIYDEVYDEKVDIYR
jgi:hypothetical protein